MSTIHNEGINARPIWGKVIGARRRRMQMRLLMLTADVTGFAAAVAILLILNLFLKFLVLNAEDIRYLVIPVLCLVLFMYSKLYPGIGINPAEEIKLIAQYITTGFVGGWIVLLWAQGRYNPNDLTYTFLWLLSMPCILLLRWFVRIQAVNLKLWGVPVVVIGRGQHVDATIAYFANRNRLGYIPVLAAVDNIEIKHQVANPIPMIELDNLLASYTDRFSREGIETALVDALAISEFFRSDESKVLFSLFHRVILVSDLNWIDGASIQIQDFEGMIGISVKKGTLTPTDAFMKRILDLIVASISLVILLPLMLAAALWIKLDSPGPVFFDQERLAKDRRKIRREGKHGRKVNIYKFRTMFTNSEYALKEYLRTYPEEQAEWDAKQKLRNDPRTTRAGRFLRKFSIDELPQLINVIKGEMSLIGPRPLPEYHHDLLSENLRNMRGTLRPGITGMWQVSGRSDSGTVGMEMWDAYYIHNWSVWLDIYILLRTIWVVFAKEGAY